MILLINKQMKDIQEFLWHLTLTHLWQWQPPKLPRVLWRIGISAVLNGCHPEHEMNRRRIFCFQEWRPPVPMVHCNICFTCKGKKCPCSNKPFKCVSNIEVLSPRQGGQSTQSTATNTCSSCSFQNNSTKVSSNIAKLQQQWFSRIVFQMPCAIRPFRCFAEFAKSCAMAGRNRYKVHGMHYAVWLQQDCWTPYAIVIVYLDSQCLGWADRLLAQVSQTQFCTHRTATISKGNIACIKAHHHKSEK